MSNTDQDQSSEDTLETNSDNNSSDKTSGENETNDESSIDTADWLTYTSSKLGISFKYPSEYEVVENDQGIITVRLELIDQIDPTLTREKELIVFGREDLMSFAVPVKDGALSISPLEICGKTNQFLPLVSGDGGFGGNSAQSIYQVMITEEVYGYLISYSENSTTYCEAEMTGQGDCSGFIPEVTSQYQTPSEDFNNGREILNTIELLAPCQ